MMNLSLDEKALINHMLTRQQLSSGTITTRMSRIHCYQNFLKSRRQNISTDTIGDFFCYLIKEKKLSRNSLNTYYHALISLEKYLVYSKITGSFMGDYRPYREEDANIIPLTLDEVYKMKNTPFSPKYAKYREMTIFLLDTGCRWEDLQALQVNNVDIMGQQIIYKQKKTGVQRIVHIEGQLLALLTDQIRNRQPEEMVFTNQRGGMMHYPDFHKFLKNLAKTAGITKRVSPHILRHTYAQNLYDQTGDIYLLKDVLKHKSINSTLRYLKNSDKKIKEAQQMHPHLAPEISPEIQIKKIQKQLESYRLDQDKKFSKKKVSLAINKFIAALYDAYIEL